MNNCNNKRRFGVELEINAFDGRSRPFDYELGNLPKGIFYVSWLVQKVVKDKVFIQKWGNNHNNDSWILKPDSSCGIEVCTPVLKGIDGVKKVSAVVDAFSNDNNIKADQRCSFHVHVDVHDLSVDQVASVISWWIKCEYVFMNMVPIKRKRNRYCQLLSFSDIVDEVECHIISSNALINSIGVHKYYSINTYHFINNKRQTIEFRIMDASACLNYFDAKNYILFLLHFVNITSKLPLLKNYEKNNQMTGYAWLDFNKVMELLGFDDDSNLSSGLKEVKEWLFIRMKQNISCEINGVFGNDFKSHQHYDVFRFEKDSNSLLNNKFIEDKFSD